VRRLALLLVGGAIWLFLAAIPALADGGPHVSTINNGSLGINADSCAGCHRAHTAAGPFLINAADEEALCLTCHGAAGTGSTVDVMSGVQYTLGANGLRTGTQLGAARNGGFDTARIDSSNAARMSYLRSATAVSQHPKVGVLAAGEAVTSAHLTLPGVNDLTQPGIAWGNGAFSATENPGPAVELSCASCHNPHGNGQYRILNPIPSASGTGFVNATAEVEVTDAALPPAGDTRNYTVIQTAIAPNAVTSGPVLKASDVVAAGYTATDGDYFRRVVPWEPSVLDPDCSPTVFPKPAACSVTTNDDAPNGLASFNVQITAWCSQCHTRYLADGNTPVAGNPYETDSGDAIFTYRHPTRSNRTCNICHVAHGSNASMTGTFSSIAPYPDGTQSASSRLLKIDNRGTCQACHDPTGTVAAGTYVGPVPIPDAP
jgi:predicted CXXCH cytochrome family protein